MFFSVPKEKYVVPPNSMVRMPKPRAAAPANLQNFALDVRMFLKGFKGIDKNGIAFEGKNLS